MRLMVCSALISLCLPQSTGLPSTDRVHQGATGPAEMCGLSAHNALAFMEVVRTSQEFEAGPDVEGFESYVAEGDTLRQILLTRPSEPAHPTVTCRQILSGPQGPEMQRNMRCEASRAACDALFLDVQQSDDALRRSLQRGG